RYENVIWLLDAIQLGDYETFSKLQVQDRWILDYVCQLPLGGTPLHIAVRLGQLNDCTREIIRKKPYFAEIKDHKGRNPLHIASAKGFLEIVKELLTQLGSSQLFDSADNEGKYVGTPLEYAIRRGRISVIKELLPIWWNGAGVISREWSMTLLDTAVEYKQFEALKMLMERYIEDELLKAKEVDGNSMSSLADDYIEIVLKHLLSPKVNYSLSILVNDIDNEEMTGTRPPLPPYFAVIKVTGNSRREENNIIDELQLSAYYPKYFREVTVRSKMVLLLSMDDGNSVTLKLLLQNPLFCQSCDFYDELTFGSILDCLKTKEVVESEMGTLLIPIWSNKVSDACGTSSINLNDDAKEDGEPDGNTELFSVAAKEDYENVSESVKADDRNDDVKDDIIEPHNQEILADISIPVRVDGYTRRNQDTISFSIGQSFASLEECRNAIKDAAIRSNTEVEFSKSTGERIVAACSDTLRCKWKIRAKANSGKRSNYVAKSQYFDTTD
ncbi:hypothetical protein MKX03_021126, partial [Papaver bracteatum]